jgi:ATP-binding cassette, subfamily B (MDR/TAP), member 1
MQIWSHNGEVISKRLRERYFEAILRQDIAFFDNVGAGEVTTRIQTDTREFGHTCGQRFILTISTDLVQQGISEKLAMCCNLLSTFIASFLLAYIRSWRLALAMSSIVPCIAVMGVILINFESRYLLMARQYVSEGGSLAEEVISTIRTAQAFGTQKVLADLYDTYIDKSKKAEEQAAAWRGGSYALFFFVLYSAYALAFSFGTTLINKGHGQ